MIGLTIVSVVGCVFLALVELRRPRQQHSREQQPILHEALEKTIPTVVAEDGKQDVDGSMVLSEDDPPRPSRAHQVEKEVPGRSTTSIGPDVFCVWLCLICDLALCAQVLPIFPLLSVPVQGLGWLVSVRNMVVVLVTLTVTSTHMVKDKRPLLLIGILFEMAAAAAYVTAFWPGRVSSAESEYTVEVITPDSSKGAREKVWASTRTLALAFAGRALNGVGCALIKPVGVAHLKDLCTSRTEENTVMPMVSNGIHLGFMGDGEARMMRRARNIVSHNGVFWWIEAGVRDEVPEICS